MSIIQPQSLTDTELARLADYYIERNGELPSKDWARELVKRFQNLVDPDRRRTIEAKQ